jgi:hypothetical protein
LLLDVLAIFLCFCCFASYEIWGVVFHGMLAPKLDVGGGTFFPGFFFLVMHDLLMRKRKTLGEERK